MLWKIKPNLKAFTLSEMLVVMMTTIIIIGFCFLVLQYLQRTFQDYQMIINLHSNQEFIEDQLFRDIDQYEHIYLALGDKMFFYNSLDTIPYQFSDNFIQREKDTIYTNPLIFHFFNRGERVTHGQVDAFEIIFKTPQERSFFFFQYNSASKRLMYEF